MTTIQACHCGAAYDPRGMCTHCDYPMTCGKTCAYCARIARTCYICRTVHGTPTQAQHCYTRCHRLERQR